MNEKKAGKRVLIIVNPNAGNAFSTPKGQLVEEHFRLSGYSTKMLFTEASGDAARIASEYAHDYSLVVCCGGDGTLSEIAGCFSYMENSPVLGYVPCGTTNDFARCIGISKRPLKAAEEIIKGTPCGFDIGEFVGEERKFIYVATFGAFSKCSYNTPHLAKSLFGHMAYVFEATKELRCINSYRLHLVFDGEREIAGEFAFASISSTASYAGIVHVDKTLDVSTSDGKFEITLVRMPKKPSDCLYIAHSLLTGNHSNNLIVTEIASTVDITADRPTEWSLDGEKANLGTSLRIVNKKQAIKIDLTF